ncbi:MAG: HAD family hydrolase [Spirochaetales bacterium]|nr:HAD family hydrolase [Spirochaetales bacterium]
MKDYETYLFDVDGTLLDTMELIYRSFRATLAKYDGPDLSRDDILSRIGIPLKNQLSLYLGDRGDTMGEIMDYHRDFQFTIYQEHLKVFPRVKEVLEELKGRNKPLAVVTSRSRSSLIPYLDQFGLTNLFDFLVEPSCTEKHKPHPDPVLYALDKLNKPAESALFVGDAYVDMESGQRAGTDTAFVLWGPNDPTKMDPQPTWLLNSMTDLV